ncbi:MAG: D-Ala-D-Ala carboxypeptidase family metallohydrolase [Pseudomonadales bacterium]
MRLLSACLACCLLTLSAATLANAPQQLPFGVKVNGVENRYPVFAAFALPDKILTLELVGRTGREISARFDGVPVRSGEHDISLRMPANPGTHRLDLSDANGNSMRLNLFVMFSTADNAFGMLNGYRIGSYPREPLRGLAIYEAPQAFVEVTAENAAVPVSPNFTLGQFVCKQGNGYPKYLVLRPELLQKLEVVLGELRSVNDRVPGLTVMSGYRTPEYNRAIGNGQYSRHIWGGAADVFVDADRNGVMDDLNGDGKVSRADSAWLAGFVDDLERKGRFGPMIGGIGVYDSTASHGPFVHIDARGFRARW